MTRHGKPGPVVVGVDEAGSAEDAVDWATAEAAARGCPLRVVHAFRPPLPADAYGFASPIDSFVTAHTAAQLILGDAVTRARSVAPGIEVSTRLVGGRPRGPCSARPGTRGCSSWAAAADPVCVPCCPDRSPALSAGTPPARSSSSALSPTGPPTGSPCGRPPVSSWVSTPPHPAPPRSVSPSTPHLNGAYRSSSCRHGHRTRRPTSNDRSPGAPDRGRGRSGSSLSADTSRGGVTEFPTVPVITTLVCADPAPL